MTTAKAAEPRVGDAMYRLAEKLFPIPRSLTGDGVRDTLHELSKMIDNFQVHEVPTGTQCFDWNVPKEWKIRDAWIEDPSGTRVVDFADHNLHVVGYSTPIDSVMSREELEPNLYSLPDQPDAIPYVTSYYKERWGFCLSDRQRQSLPQGDYRVYIDSELIDGSLTYGEVLIPGQREEEIFLSTYVCHPMMANNELSGPCVATYLARWLQNLNQRKYSYRVVFIPETIGSIAYLSRHIDEMKRKIIAGFNLTCCGDDRCYSYLPSRAGDTLADQVALHVLHHTDPSFKRYSYLDRGSDERQYCSPGVDLPVASVMRSKFHTYPEYHTSLDDLSLISPEGLAGTFHVLKRCLECIEQDCIPRAVFSCEPQLGPRGLYPDLSIKDGANHVKQMMNLLAYSDGKIRLIEIADRIGQPMWEVVPHLDRLVNAGLIEIP
jgi:aminopeptidase-like protein